MIELTTGVVFLMSSLYGSSDHVANTYQADVQQNIVAEEATTTVASSLKDSHDPKVIEAYLRKEFANEPILVEIARCESNFRQYDKNGKVLRGYVDSDDIGLMQINQRFWGEPSKKLGMDIHTMEGNIAYARELYRDQGVKPWSSSAKCWSSALNSAELAKK